MGRVCSRPAAHADADAVLPRRASLAGMPTTIHEAILAQVGRLHPLLFVNRALSDVAQRALLADAAPTTERAARSLVKLFARRPEYGLAVRRFTISTLPIVAGRRGRASQPPTAPQRLVLVQAVAGNLRDFTLTLGGEQAVDVMPLFEIVAKRGGGRRADAQGASVGRLGLARIELLRGSGMADGGVELAHARWPYGADGGNELVMLCDNGVPAGAVLASVASTSHYDQSLVRVKWSALDSSDRAQTRRLRRLTVVDHGHGAARHYDELRAYLPRLVNLERLTMVSLMFDQQLLATLPPSLIRLDVLCFHRHARWEPAVRALTKICEGDALPALRHVYTLALFQTPRLDDACRRRGIAIEYRDTPLYVRGASLASADSRRCIICNGTISRASRLSLNDVDEVGCQCWTSTRACCGVVVYSLWTCTSVRALQGCLHRLVKLDYRLVQRRVAMREVGQDLPVGDRVFVDARTEAPVPLPIEPGAG